jgi:hypothetical protein
MKPFVDLVISGGQTGVDQAALRAARDCGIAIGGWCPPGRACDGGVIPPEFPFRETPVDRSPDAPHVPRSQRTQWNVRDADATLILHDARSGTSDPGTDLTARFATDYARPLLICDVADARACDSHRAVALATTPSARSTSPVPASEPHRASATPRMRCCATSSRERAPPVRACRRIRAKGVA